MFIQRIWSQQKNRVGVLLFLAAALASCSSYFIEWFFETQPCKLCVYQRYAYLALTFVAGLAIWQQRLQLLALLSWAAICTLTVFQYGVEQHWWQYKSTCTSYMPKGQSFAEFKAAMAQASVVSCEHPTFSFLHLSLSGWSALYSLAVLACASYCFWYTKSR